MNDDKQYCWQDPTRANPWQTREVEIGSPSAELVKAIKAKGTPLARATTYALMTSGSAGNNPEAKARWWLRTNEGIKLEETEPEEYSSFVRDLVQALGGVLR